MRFNIGDIIQSNDYCPGDTRWVVTKVYPDGQTCELDAYPGKDYVYRYTIKQMISNQQHIVQNIAPLMTLAKIDELFI